VVIRGGAGYAYLGWTIDRFVSSAPENGNNRVVQNVDLPCHVLALFGTQACRINSDSALKHGAGVSASTFLASSGTGAGQLVNVYAANDSSTDDIVLDYYLGS